ncbi:MAG: glycosyltransferase family 4 protein [Desulfurococcaceae archaeon]
MKIGVFITRFPTHNIVGGAENVAYNLSLALIKRGIAIKVFTVDDKRDSFERDGLLEIHRYKAMFKMGKGKFSWKLFKEPIKYDLSLVHAHFSVPFAEFAGMRVAKKKGIPFLITYHGDWVASYGNIVRKITMTLINKFVDKLLSSADAIVVPSKFYINDSKYLPKYREKIHVIENGINLDQFQINYTREECRKMLSLPENKYVVLYFGALIDYKSPDTLLRAAKLVLEHRKDVLFLIAGSGPMEKELLALAQKLNIAQFVRFEGFVNEELKPIYFNAADLFVLPSTMPTEVFPIALLEASASGLPMIASDLNTFKCVVVDGYNGIFTKRGDEWSLAEAIIYLLGNEDERKRMGRNAKEKVKGYSWDKIAEKYEKIYKELII